MKTTDIYLPEPHRGQNKVWTNGGLYNGVCCGRRWGKTNSIISLAANGIAIGAKVGLFTPEHKQWQEPYDEISDRAHPIIKKRSKTDAFLLSKMRGKLDFWHLNDNELAGRGREYDIILIDEAAFTKNTQMRGIWDKGLVPTMATRPNAQVWAYSTPNGVNPENFFYQLAHDPTMGFTMHYAPSSENPAVDKAWLEKQKTEMHPDVYRQEILAQFVDWTGVAFFGLDKWLVDGQAHAMPTKCDRVFAVIDSAVKTGSANDGTAVIYFARNQYHGTQLIILDWDIIQIEGALLDTWLTGVHTRCLELAQMTGAREGVKGIWIEDKASGMILLQQARKRQMPVMPIGGTWMTLGKDERAISVSGYHHQGKCKVSTLAHDKIVSYKGAVRNHLESQVTSFRLGDKDAAKRADDLLDTYVHGLALALGNGDQF